MNYMDNFYNVGNASVKIMPNDKEKDICNINV